MPPECFPSSGSRVASGMVWREAPSSAKHRFHVPPEQVSGERVRFSSGQAHQILNVLRLRPGAVVRVFDGVRPVDFLARLERVTESDAEAVVERQVTQPPEPRTAIVACPALLRRDAFEQVLDSLTQLGIAAIAPVVSARCVARDLPDERRAARWKAILKEAAEQSGRGVVPMLRPVQKLQASAMQASSEGLALLAYEAKRDGAIGGALAGHAVGTVSLFVGPEGGFEEDEVEMARGMGVQVVSLGPRVLRAETASAAFLALVLHALGDL